MTPETLSKRSVLYRLAHDEWCSHDEADDGIPCDCHLSVIAALRKRLEAARPFVEAAAEEAFTGAKWAELAQAWLDGAALKEKP